MAKFDKSQGFTFVYTDFFKAYQKAKRAKLEDVLAIDRRGDFLRPMSVIEAEERVLKKQVVAGTMDPLAELKQSLSSLSKAHSKLRFMLEEIESATKKPSRS